MPPPDHPSLPPERRVRTLVVDDSRVARRIITTALASDPAIEVVGQAETGKVALGMLDSVRPDLVTLDIEMPEMDGLATLVAIRATHPTLPVLMVSALTERAAAVTLDALARGADDYVTKPSGLAGGTDVTAMTAELVAKVKALALRPKPSVVPRRSFQAPGAMTAPPARVVAMAASLGGPNALPVVLRGLPTNLAVAVLVVQHMPPLFTRLFAERLHTDGPLRVREAAGGEPPRAGDVWIAPGDHHMTVRSIAGSIRIDVSHGERENSCRPAADVLFRGVAAVYGSATLAVVLTGMGQDGLAGARAVKDLGGQVIVQDKATSVAWGMPGAVVNAGLADAVLPLDQIAAEIVRRTRIPLRPTG